MLVEFPRLLPGNLLGRIWITDKYIEHSKVRIIKLCLDYDRTLCWNWLDENGLEIQIVLGAINRKQEEDVQVGTQQVVLPGVVDVVKALLAD